MDDLIQKFATAIIDPAIKALFIGALLIFLFGVVEYIKNSDKDDDRKKGRSHIMWGIIGMAIMVSAEIIINIAVGTINELGR
jgi:FtsH-binding integral membrane protein